MIIIYVIKVHRTVLFVYYVSFLVKSGAIYPAKIERNIYLLPIIRYFTNLNPIFALQKNHYRNGIGKKFWLAEFYQTAEAGEDCFEMLKKRYFQPK